MLEFIHKQTEWYQKMAFLIDINTRDIRKENRKRKYPHTWQIEFPDSNMSGRNDVSGAYGFMILPIGLGKSNYCNHEIHERLLK